MAKVRFVCAISALSVMAAGMVFVGCSDNDPAGTTADAGTDRSTPPDAGVNQDATTSADVGTDVTTADAATADATNDSAVDAGDNCTVLTVTARSESKSSAPGFTNRITMRFTPNIGDPVAAPDAGFPFPIDRLHMDLWDLQAATDGGIVLGTGVNANNSTCKQCVAVYQDFNPGDNGKLKLYFAESGSIKLDALGGTDAGLTSAKGSLSNVRLVEVTLATGITPNSASTPVADGGCMRIVTAPFEFPIPPADAGSDAASDAASDAPDGG